MSKKLPISSILVNDPMSKPARLQVDPDSIQDQDKPSMNGSTFNIWYLKWSGGSNNPNNRQNEKSKFRCSIKHDQGYTKTKKSSPICVFFSRGCCYLGYKCHYHHRLPLATDVIPSNQDCFGREKTANYKEDMDGVGSYNYENHTLFVGNIRPRNNVEDLLRKNFSEFGTVENVRVLSNKSSAFVTFKLESEAQFAKEAMQSQCLDESDTNPIYVRWSNEITRDPSQDKRKREQISAIDTVKNMMESDTRKKIKITSNSNGKGISEIVHVKEVDEKLLDDEGDDGDEEDDEADENETGDVEKLIIKPRKEGSLKKNGLNGYHNYTLENNNSNNFKQTMKFNNQRNQIINDATLKDVARFKKKLIFKRQEPNLVSVIGNYSTDEDDD